MTEPCREYPGSTIAAQFSVRSKDLGGQGSGRPEALAANITAARPEPRGREIDDNTGNLKSAAKQRGHRADTAAKGHT
ncbi:MULTISPECIES: hypothetical protein, partial [unclassified Phaeobacter]|uniref:hypothetical protein n=1 Tax=unclassified Phaeobacter TaxID=2621772 RepID=UPI003A866449